MSMLSIRSHLQGQGDGSLGPICVCGSAAATLCGVGSTVAKVAVRGVWIRLDLAGEGGTVHFPDQYCQQICC